MTPADPTTPTIEGDLRAVRLDHERRIDRESDPNCTICQSLARLRAQYEKDQEIIRAARVGMFNARQQLRGLRGVALRDLEAQISHVIEDLKATAVRCGEELRYLDQHEEGFRWLEDEPTFVPGQSPANRR